jgi:hypothetical protein
MPVALGSLILFTPMTNMYKYSPIEYLHVSENVENINISISASKHEGGPWIFILFGT